MILGLLFFIQTFLKHCKALSAEKYKRYTKYFIIIFIRGTVNCVSVLESTVEPLVSYHPKCRLSGRLWEVVVYEKKTS